MQDDKHEAQGTDAGRWMMHLLNNTLSVSPYLCAVGHF